VEAIHFLLEGIKTAVQVRIDLPFTGNARRRKLVV
jgi:hypothetical protein